MTFSYFIFCQKDSKSDDSLHFPILIFLESGKKRNVYDIFLFYIFTEKDTNLDFWGFSYFKFLSKNMSQMSKKSWFLTLFDFDDNGTFWWTRNHKITFLTFLQKFKIGKWCRIDQLWILLHFSNFTTLNFSTHFYQTSFLTFLQKSKLVKLKKLQKIFFYSAAE